MNSFEVKGRIAHAVSSQACRRQSVVILALFSLFGVLALFLSLAHLGTASRRMAERARKKQWARSHRLTSNLSDNVTSKPRGVTRRERLRRLVVSSQSPY